MINCIKIKENSGLSPTIRTINFGRINIIIGPKGGGKSTLFDLLANAINGKLLSTTINALETHNLELHSITIDNDEIFKNSFSTILVNPKNKAKKIYLDRSDVIYQDDEIKKDLTSSTNIAKMTSDFAKTLANESVEFGNIINMIRNFHTAIQKVIKNDHNVNFSTTFDVRGKRKTLKEAIIFQLNYSSVNSTTQLNNALKFLNNELAFHKDTKETLKRQINNISLASYPMLSQDFINEIRSSYKELIVKLEHTLKLIEKEKILLKKKKNVIKAFSIAYKTKVAELKKGQENENNREKIIASYISKAEQYFKVMASGIKEVNQTFEKFIEQEIVLNFNNSQETDGLLTMVLNEQIKLEEEFKFDLLKKILYNAKRVQSHPVNWIMSAIEKGVKDFKEESLISELAKFLKNKISLQADGINYETMSLGQRSIYGMRHKFKEASGKAMFLDQPEDNLDNATIASEVLKMITNQKEQIFIVTHNANIGILTKPDKVIICAFEKFNKEKQTVDQYQEAVIKSIDVAHKPVDYLEGGLKYIEQRLKLIKEDK